MDGFLVVVDSYHIAHNLILHALKLGTELELEETLVPILLGQRVGEHEVARDDVIIQVAVAELDTLVHLARDERLARAADGDSRVIVLLGVALTELGDAGGGLPVLVVVHLVEDGEDILGVHPLDVTVYHDVYDLLGLVGDVGQVCDMELRTVRRPRVGMGAESVHGGAEDESLGAWAGLEHLVPVVGEALEPALTLVACENGVGEDRELMIGCLGNVEAEF